MIRQYKFRLEESWKALESKYPKWAYVAQWLILSICIGVPIGSASALFLYTLDWVTALRVQYAWLLLGLPVAGLAVGMLYYRWGSSVEGGNNLIFSTIKQADQARIPFRMTVFIYIGTIVTHLFGGSAGREGTALQMAGGIADQWTKFFRIDTIGRRILLMSAIGAGFGAVFGTPWAGVVFALEVVVLPKFPFKAIFPIVASTFWADMVVRAWGVGHTAYPTWVSIGWQDWTTWGQAVLAGLVFGAVAVAFCVAMDWMGKGFKLIKFAPLRPFVAGVLIIVGVWGIGTTRYIGLGIPTILDSFGQTLSYEVFILKILFTVLTLSAEFKGGEVTPLFFIGTTLGSALSRVLVLPTQLLASMGFVGVFAGATHTPWACTVMAMELFGISCGLYVAIACWVAHWVARGFSIYSHQRKV